MKSCFDSWFEAQFSLKKILNNKNFWNITFDKTEIKEFYIVPLLDILRSSALIATFNITISTVLKKLLYHWPKI